MALRRLLVFIGSAVAIVACASAWTLASADREPPPRGQYTPIPQPKLVVSEDDRRELIRRALARFPNATLAGATVAPEDPVDLPGGPRIHCLFLSDEPSGTTSKFDCVLDGGAVIKVKYGRNPETHAEVAGTRLLTALGYPADRVDFVPMVRCHGCPRHPFIAMRTLHALGLRQRFSAHLNEGGYTDFLWPTVERKFEGYAVETAVQQGWAWWELPRAGTVAAEQRAELDALRLLAAFLAHWDNKASNQRLVCESAECTQPLLMLQDLGATFGPWKANLAQWQLLPIWREAASCTLTMRHQPWGGGTFPDVEISEAGRRRLLERLDAISDEEIRALFRTARFHEYYSSTDDERDVTAWANAFRQRVRQIHAAGPCPD